MCNALTRVTIALPPVIVDVAGVVVAVVVEVAVTVEGAVVEEVEFAETLDELEWVYAVFCGCGSCCVCVG